MYDYLGYPWSRNRDLGNQNPREKSCFCVKIVLICLLLKNDWTRTADICAQQRCI